MSHSIVCRRNFLRGAGAFVALPMFSSLSRSATSIESSSAIEAPRRLAFVYHPNGVNVDRWRVTSEAADLKLSPTLAPLDELRENIQLFSGLEHANATAGGDGAGDHARAGATFLTGARARKTGGADIRVGVSVDQQAALAAGHQTRFPSLELSCDRARKSGVCDSGYSCAYQFNMSWRNARSPITPEANPRLVFERMFGGTDSESIRDRIAARKSVLDFVAADAQRLTNRLGRQDQHKLDEYLEGVRSIERRIEWSESSPELPRVDYAMPAGIPQDYKTHLRLMFDMMALAFQTDSTRIVTFLMAHDGSNRSFEEIGVPDGHHTISHHMGDADKMDKIARIDKFYIEQFAYFLQQLRDTPAEDGQSLLHHSMIVYGGGISDGNSHRHDDLPILLAGGGGGTLCPGRHVRLSQAQPMSNLYVALLQRMGVPTERFGDSTGELHNV